MLKKIKAFLKRYPYVWLFSYHLLYLPWFNWLNAYTPGRPQVTDMHCLLDDLIPFSEWFAIPYFLWFAYIALGYVFFFFYSQREFARMCIFLYTGMTLCLIIYTVFPNGQSLRIDYDTLGRRNIWIWALNALQSGDTPYNVFPSIHCLNSIGVNIACFRNAWFKKHRWALAAVTLLTCSICLSTVFVKQHSVLDVFGALILAVPLYLLAYRVPWHRLKKDPS